LPVTVAISRSENVSTRAPCVYGDAAVRRLVGADGPLPGAGRRAPPPPPPPVRGGGVAIGGGGGGCSPHRGPRPPPPPVVDVGALTDLAINLVHHADGCSCDCRTNAVVTG